MSSSAAKFLNATFVPSDLAAGSLMFEWGGPLEHLAPTGTTPLAKKLQGKTNCALYIIAVGSLIWAARRLMHVSDVGPVLSMAETLYCYQHDPRYFNEDSPEHLTRPLPVQVEVVETLCAETTAIFMETPGRHASRPPIQAVQNIVSVTRHVLGPDWKQAFGTWLKQIIERLDAIASNPNQTFKNIYNFDSLTDFETYVRANMGPPQPLEVCLVSDPYDATAQGTLFSSRLGEVDWAGNPYLSSPDAMLALGCQNPYKAF